MMAGKRGFCTVPASQTLTHQIHVFKHRMHMIWNAHTGTPSHMWVRISTHGTQILSKPVVTRLHRPHRIVHPSPRQGPAREMSETHLMTVSSHHFYDFIISFIKILPYLGLCYYVVRWEACCHTASGLYKWVFYNILNVVSDVLVKNTNEPMLTYWGLCIQIIKTSWFE